MSDSEEKHTRNLYRSFLRQEIKRTDIQQAKKELISAHFSKERPFFLKPAFSIPALSLAGAVMFALLVGRPLLEKIPVPMKERSVRLEQAAQPVPLVSSVSPPGAPKALPVNPTLVDVKWAVSDVGPTMVYQKHFQDVPVTIIWVFPGEGKL